MAITVFSRSTRGYNREQVDEYIASLNRAYAKTTRGYEKKIEALEAEIAKLHTMLESAQSDARAVESTPAPVPAVDTEADEKSRRYDEISQRLGEILINANAEASAMLREADERVSTTLNETADTVRAELASVIKTLERLADEAQARLSSNDI